MATKEIVLLKMGTVAATAAAAINITDATLANVVVQNTTALTAKGLTNIGGMCVDYSGNIYVTDYAQHIILKLTEGGVVTTVAGQRGVSGNNSAPIAPRPVRASCNAGTCRSRASCRKSA